MADINLTTDFSQLVAMNQEVKSTDTLFVKVVDSLLREVKRANRVTKALAETTEQNLKIINAAEQIAASKVQEAATKREKARQREADRAEKEAQRIIAANEKTAAAQAKLTAEIERNKAASAQASTANLNQRLGVTGAPATSQGAGFGAMEAEIERLRMKYDQVYSASNLYERSLAELDRAHMLGITSTKRHEAAVEQLNLEYQQFANATEGAVIANNRFSQHVNESGRGLNKFGMYAQQVGYQVGDFFVQIQSGTNVLVAFGQQATQLAGLFPGVLGAALGIGISLATALGAAWMRMGENADSTAKGILTLADAQKQLNEASGDYALKLEMLRFGVDTQAKAVALKEIYGITAQIQNLTKQYGETDSLGTRQRLAEEIQALKEQLSIQQDIVDEASKKRDAYETALNIDKQMAAVELGQAKAIGQAEKDRVAAGEAIYKGLLAVQSANQDIVRSNNEVSEAVKNTYQVYAKTRLEADALTAATDNVAKYLFGAEKNAANFNKAMEDALAAGVQFSLVDLSSIVAIAARNGWDLAASIQAAWSAATQKAPAAASVLVGGGGRPDVGIDRNAIAGAEALMVQKRRKEAEAATKGAGGGGGEPSESMLEKFQKQLELEKELLNTTETYQRVRSALGEEFESTSPKIIDGLMQQAEGIKELTRLEDERKSLMDTVNSTLEGGFMDIVKGTKTVGEAFKSMAASILEELFQVLVVQKLVAGFTGSPGGKGFANLFGGGKTFTNVGGLTGGGRASGGSMMSGQPYLVGEQGPEIVIPRHSGTVVNANQTAGAMAGSGGITVQNNITVTGSDAAMVRQEVAKMIPQITNATKAAVIDAKQRGGQMAAAFR